MRAVGIKTVFQVQFLVAGWGDHFFSRWEVMEFADEVQAREQYRVLAALARRSQRGTAWLREKFGIHGYLCSIHLDREPLPGERPRLRKLTITTEELDDEYEG